MAIACKTQTYFVYKSLLQYSYYKSPSYSKACYSGLLDFNGDTGEEKGGGSDLEFFFFP